MEKITICVHPYYFAAHYAINGCAKTAKEFVKKQESRYQAGINAAKDGVLVILSGTTTFDAADRLQDYARQVIPPENLYIADETEAAYGYLEERIGKDVSPADVFLFGEDIGACVPAFAVRFHKRFQLQQPVVLLAHYCGVDVPSLQHAYNAIHANMHQRDRSKLTVRWEFN